MTDIVFPRRALWLSAALAGPIVIAVASAGCIFCGWGDSMTLSGSGEGGVLPPGDAQELIAEADILDIVGDRLYALSEEGLSVIDLGQPGTLRLLGQQAVAGEPLEMYVRDGVVLVMTDLAEQHATRVTAIDVSAEAALAARGSVDVFGNMSDSRIYADILYLVTFVASSGRTTITSLDTLGGGPPVQLDQVAYFQEDHGLGLRRSVMMTTERLYVAGVEWDGWSNDGHSTIRVIDISSGGGALEEGASVEARGQILSRWQMDEYQGVLRVVSQPGTWSDQELPSVQTFQVVSAAELVPLAQVDFIMTVRESLRSVRFDGPRAYAITADAPGPYDPTPGSEVQPMPPMDSCGDGCDPLFVFDLTDPIHPEQKGKLEMPGWVFHMEPRGGQLVALGFEGSYPLGQLNLSLFDVQNPNAPWLVDRVAFGGELSGYGEDQNRIHKTLAIFDAEGLIAVPYGSWEWIPLEVCDDDMCGSDCRDEGFYVKRGAVKLVDWSGGHLVGRGTAAVADGWALRARLHDSRLVVMSDNGVSLFDIQDRDAPARDDKVRF